MNFLKYFFCTALLCFLFFDLKAQITYNWQNSKEGWVPANGGNCNLTAQPDAMAMRLYSSAGLMRSGDLSADLGISATDYNQVEITVKNPTTGSGVARLFIYPPGTNTDTCFYSFQVDTGMTTFSTYTISLDSFPNGSNSVYTGPIARFGLRAPWGGANFDTIFWKQMIVSNTNQVIDSVNVIAKVDMSQVSFPFTTPEINGTFNNWCGDCNPMYDADGDNIWETTLRLFPGDTVEYKFTTDNFTNQESLNPNDSCTNGNVNYTNRVAIVPSSDLITNAVCWESCDICSTIGNVSLNTQDFSIYPNPATDKIFIESAELINDLVLYDLLGNVLFEIHNINSNHFQFDLTPYSGSLFLINLNFSNFSISKKLIRSF